MTEVAQSRSKVDADAARTALENALGSPNFATVGRLKRFLSFIVEQTLVGNGENLKEFLIGIEVFEKPDSFDPRTDPIVRVQARRLRAKLTQYYETEGRDDGVWIDLPKGSYVPVFHRREKGAPKLTSAGSTECAITVLPFADRSSQSDQKFFSGGLRDEILHRITRLSLDLPHALRVVPYARLEPGTIDLAQLPGVTQAIEGSVRKSGQRYRITIQRIDTQQQKYVWSETFESVGEDLLACQDRIAAAVVAEIQRSLTVVAPKAGDTAAAFAEYELYLQGRYHLSRRSERGIRRAIESFETAIAANERYALAYAGLADAHALLANYGYVPPATATSEAERAAARGVALNENIAETHTSLAHVRATLAWDWVSAEAGFHRAIEINARHAAAHHWFGIACLAPLGRLDEAAEHCEIALRLDPTSAILARDLAEVYYFQRTFSAAADQAQATIDSDPHFHGAYWILGLVHEQFGDFAEAIDCFEEALHLAPGNPRMMSALGRALALSGENDAARATIAKLEELAKQRYVSPLDPALVYLGLGDSKRGFAELARLAQSKCFDLIHLRVDPRFDAWRTSAQFDSVASRLSS